MGLVTCRFYALDQEIPYDPVSGVNVRIFDETGAVFVTSGVTNASGYFQCDITGTPDPAPTRYQVRMSKVGTTWTNPEYADVYDPLPPLTVNNFNMYGNLHPLQPAVGGARMCRVQGFLYDAGGRAVPNAIVKFINKFDPVYVDGVAVIAGVEVESDATGWVDVELFRTGKYEAQVSGFHTHPDPIEIPDADSVGLAEVLWPIVSSVTWNPVAPWAVAVGGSLEVTPTVVTSSGVTLTGTANGDLNYESGDTSIARVSVDDDKVTIIGVATGATTLIITRKDEYNYRIPEVAVVGSGGAITVA